MRNNQRNKLFKVSQRNRKIFIRVSLTFSLFGCIAILISATTNNWIYTAERLKYWEKNGTDAKIPEYFQPIYWKNATFGPWQICWRDPITPFHCVRIAHSMKITTDASDTTEAIEIAVRKTVYCILASVLLELTSTSLVVTANIRLRKYTGVLASGVLHSVTGLSMLLILVVYISSVTQEVGKKLYPESHIEAPLFYYQYGYSFYIVVLSFMSTEVAAVFSLFVYMARHDEEMYNRYHIRNLFAGGLMNGVMGFMAARGSSASGGAAGKARTHRTNSSLSSGVGQSAASLLNQQSTGLPIRKDNTQLTDLSSLRLDQGSSRYSIYSDISADNVPEYVPLAPSPVVAQRQQHTTTVC